jgi:hypothetical protein
MNDISPMKTSSNNGIYANLLFQNTINMNDKYNAKCTIRKECHHMGAPKVSGPVFLELVMYKYKKPIIGMLVSIAK